MTPNESRLEELLDRLEATLNEIRQQLSQGQGPQGDHAGAVEAFADEAFRARDA